VDFKDIYRLYPETWLNDEIVNFYFELLSERATANKENKDMPSIHCFNTFFCSTLRDQGFAKVKRWTKRVSNPF
jgi:sentrin-specific protease 1